MRLVEIASCDVNKYVLLPGQHWSHHSICVKFVFLLTCRIVRFWNITKTNRASHIDHHWKFPPHFVKCCPQSLISRNILWSLGERFLMMTSTPVTVCKLFYSCLLNDRCRESSNVREVKRGKKTSESSSPYRDVLVRGRSVFFAKKFRTVL